MESTRGRQHNDRPNRSRRANRFPKGLGTRFLSGTLLLLGSPYQKPNGKKKGTLIVMGLLRNLVKVEAMEGHSEIRDMGLSES